MSGKALDPLVRDRLRALRSRAERDARGELYLEGVSAFIQACGSEVPFALIVWSEVLLRSGVAQKLVRMQRRRGVRTIHVSPETFRSFTRAGRASGIAAVARFGWRPLGPANPSAGLCWIGIERIRAHGNLGTILRTADAVGAGGLIVFGPDADPFDLRAIRASMGTVFHVPIVRSDYGELRAWTAQHGVQVVATTPAATRLHTELRYRSPTLVLLGDERRGLTPLARSLATDEVRIPVCGQRDSLNVGVAAGVVLYELNRQRALR